MYVLGDRPSWHNWAMGIADAVATRSDCTRDRVGAVILDPDHRVIGTGYPGVAPAARGCLEGACPRGQLTPAELSHGSPYDYGPGLCISTHAEINAMLQAAGKLDGSTMYITRQPCQACMKTIVNSTISRVVYRETTTGRNVVKIV